MNIRSMFKNIFGKDDYSSQDNRQFTDFRLLNGMLNVFSPWDGNSYDDATVRTCVDAIAKHAGKLKPKHVRRQDKKIIETNSALDSVLSARPNEYMNTYDFLYKIVSQLYSFNNAFIYVKTDPAGNVVGLYPLNYSDVALREYEDQMYCQFNFMLSGRITVPYTDIIHLRKHFNREDFYGESNEKPLRSPLNVLNIVKQALENAVRNCTKLRGYLRFMNNLNPKDIQEQTKRFVDQFLNVANASGIAAVDNKVEFNQLTSDIQTANAAQMNFAREDIYRYFGINDKIITGNYNEDEWNAFYESVLEPLAIQMSLEFTDKLFTEREKGYGNEVVFETNRLQYASMPSKVSMVSALLPQGILSINEAREIFGFAAVEDGDKRQVSLNFVAADKQNKYQLGEQDPKPNSSEGGDGNEPTE